MTLLQSSLKHPSNHGNHKDELKKLFFYLDHSVFHLFCLRGLVLRIPSKSVLRDSCLSTTI